MDLVNKSSIKISDCSPPKLINYKFELNKKAMREPTGNKMLLWTYNGNKIDVDLSKNIDTSVKFQFINGRYVFEGSPGHFFLDFANKYLGGGWSNYGWVQEEILVNCMPNLLRVLSDLDRAYKRKERSNYPQISSDLSELPQIYYTEACLEWVGDNYGGKGATYLNQYPSEIHKEFKTIDPVFINWVGRAYLNRSKNKGYSYTNFELNHLFWCNVKTYVAILVAGSQQNFDSINIHDGAGGCGVYGHHINTVMAMQNLTLNVAIDIVKPTKPVNAYWHVFGQDKPISDLPKGETPIEILGTIKELAKKDKRYY